jgi:hypothetical protein
MDNVVDGKLIECTAEHIAAAEAAARLNQAGSPERLEHLGKIIPRNPRHAGHVLGGHWPTGLASQHHHSAKRILGRLRNHGGPRRMILDLKIQNKDYARMARTIPVIRLY